MTSDELMIRTATGAARSPRSMARWMALGFVWLGWLLVVMGPLVGLLMLASPVPGVWSALLPALGGCAAGALLVVFGELSVAVFDIADGSPGSRR